MNIAVFTVAAIVGICAANADPKSLIDCYPEPGASEERCKQRGCIWAEQAKGIPWCSMPADAGYAPVKNGDQVVELKKGKKMLNLPYGDPVSPLLFAHETRESVLYIQIGNKERYRPDLFYAFEGVKSREELQLKYEFKEPFTFKVIRPSSGTVIWDTSIGGLVFYDQYIQIAAKLGITQLYGFGEHVHQQIHHDLGRYTTWPMLARDEGPNSEYNPSTANLYGVHGFYMGMEKDGKAHGVLILNTGPQEVTVGPAPHIVYRSIAGMFEIYFFPGPTPEEVIQQYLGLIGRPALPAYWSLGFQMCKYGYKDTQELKEAVSSVREAGIPFDVAYADIDYMNRYQDFTLGAPWKDFPKYVNELHENNMHLILIFDPAIQVDGEPYKRAMETKAKFIEWPELTDVQKELNEQYPLTNGTKVMLGVVWPDRHVAFPDFTSESTMKWWRDEIKKFHEQIAFDGIWIDMNEPANFGTNKEKPWYYDNPDHPNIKPLMCHLQKDQKWEVPPYQTWSVYLWGNQSYLSTKTACMVGTLGNTNLYNAKNLYGLQESIVTADAVVDATGKRGVVISRSTFPSSGQYGGHWLGDNSATWDDLRTSIIGIQEFNMFGIPYVGADICGFRRNTTEELCLRWQQLGAFYPFSRNHNDNNSIKQHPSLWPSVARATKQANLFRYYYLPYLFSLHFEASLSGTTVVRPVFFEFTDDPVTRTLSFQFMWGNGMMIVPVYQEGKDKVEAYLPPSATWYSLRDEEYGTVARTNKITLSATKEQLIPVFARGGVIIPRQKPEVTTVQSRMNPFELLIAIDPKKAMANGFLYWDDGDSDMVGVGSYKKYYKWNFQYKEMEESSVLEIVQNKTSAAKIAVQLLDRIDILGYDHNQSSISLKINEKAVGKADYEYNSKNNVLTLRNLKLNIVETKHIKMEWSHKIVDSGATASTRCGLCFTTYLAYVLISVLYSFLTS